MTGRAVTSGEGGWLEGRSDTAERTSGRILWEKDRAGGWEGGGNGGPREGAGGGWAGCTGQQGRVRKG